MFDSTASLLNAERQPLTDDSLVAVWAEDTAFNVDEDGDGNAVEYPSSVRVPLVASDGGIVGFGAPIGRDDTNFNRGNEEFVLNVLDVEVGGGTILFDEGHGQFYDTGKFKAFIRYAERNGYAIEATDDLAADLDGARAAIITSPSEAFTDTGLNALTTFVEEGGSLLLFDQSDFRSFDATANLNEIAMAVDVAFRFNDDQVLDPKNNVGPDFIPLTDEFNTAFEYFDERPGLGVEIDPAQTYAVEVVEVTDGDTIDVRFDNGAEGTVRMLGIDTPETSSQFERPEEWEGIESLEYLRNEGFVAEDYAVEKLAGETVTLAFDENEPVRGDFGRLLAYVSVNGTLYNQQAIADGHARVYDSGLAKHDEFLRTERNVRVADRGMWSQSDPADSTTIRNDPVKELFFPQATSVTAMGEPIDDKRVPVSAASTAQQEGSDVRYERDIPLVGIDQLARVGMIGAPIISEDYEQAEGYPVDTSGFGNFAFLANLTDRLSDREEGPVLIDGGHGQFGASYGLSAEDAAYYLRYLEGVNVGFEGINDIADGFGADLLAEARALVITTPVEAFTDDELDAVQEFVADGGGVVLVGAAAPADARRNLDAIADALCSDLRLNTGQVVNPEANLNTDPSVLTTSNFDQWFRLFGGYTGDTKFKGARGGPGRPGCHADGRGKPKSGRGKSNKRGHGRKGRDEKRTNRGKGRKHGRNR
jgi:endonuclease YncB( thermonuclease family)